MIEFGKTLRTAREAKGYTVAQLADITKLMPSLIDDLEKEDFGRIAAPIYGRGFVKLYCEAVGLEPKPMVSEFMEILNGNRDTTIRERKTVFAAPNAPSEPVAAPEPAAAAEDTFRLEAEILPAAPAVAPAEAAPPAAPAEDLRLPDPFEPPRVAPQHELFDTPPAPAAAPDAHATAQTISRYAAPLDERSGYAPGPSLASFWRFGALMLAALVLFVLIVLGVRALYRATSPGGAARAPEPVAAVTPATTPAADKAAEPAAPRQQQKIPDVYVD